MNSLDFDIKESKVKVRAKSNMVKNLFWGPVCQHGTLNDDKFELSWMCLDGSTILGKMRSKVKCQGHIWSKKAGHMHQWLTVKFYRVSNVTYSMLSVYGKTGCMN